METKMIWRFAIVLIMCFGCGKSEPVVNQPESIPAPTVKRELVQEPAVPEDFGLSSLRPLKYMNASSLDRIVDAVEAQSDDGNMVAREIVRQCLLALGREYLLEQLGKTTRRPKKNEITTWIDEVADKSLKGDPFFAVVFAQAHFRGLGVSKNTTQAVVLLENAADAGSGPAQLALARHYETNRTAGENFNTDRVRELYMAAAEDGLPPAWYALGEIWAGGADENLQDLDKALEYWMKAAARGHARAQYRAGIAHLDKGSKLLGLSLLTGAARQGNLPAAASLEKLEHNWGRVMSRDEYLRYIEERERALALSRGQEKKKPLPRVNVTILMYSKPNCTKCDEARQYMQSKYMDFVEFNVQKDTEARAASDRLNPQKILPTLKIGDFSMSGFDEESFLNILAMAAERGR